jgi:hypothetical protein
MKWSMIALLLVTGGCAAESRRGISDEQFITTMVELRRAARAAESDTARFVELRREVLERQGVSEAELRAYVESGSRDLLELAAVWDSIGARLAEQEAQ